MHPRLQAANTAVPELTATRFFAEICPAVLDARRSAVEEIGGAFAFLVRGEGSWILDFNSASVIGLSPGVRADVDLAIELDAANFTRLMKGTLDVKAAMSDGLIDVKGDLGLLPNLTAALRPSA
jgi:hypothetical protein